MKINLSLYDDEFSEEKHDELIEKAMDSVRENGLLLELNPHLAIGLADESRVYPSVTTTQRALAKGIRFSYGSDAHTPDHVGDTSYYRLLQ